MPDKPVLESVKELDEPKQPATEPAVRLPTQKHCRVCGIELDEKHHKYCSTECWRIAKANKSSVPSEPQPASTEPRQPVIAKTVPNQTVSKRGILGEGAPTKCTPEIIEAVIRDRCRGHSLEQSCAYNGCSHDQWTEWEKRPEFATIRHRAEAEQLNHILTSMDAAIQNKLDWRGYSFLLERVKSFRDQFADPNKVGIQINQQFNNGNSGGSQAELGEARRRLDEAKIAQQKRKAGISSNAELREYYVERRDESQRLIDRLDAGETPNQEDQQKLYRLDEDGSDREQQPIREAVGRVVGHTGGQLAIEDESTLKPAPEPEPRQSDHSSGIATEPPTPWRDRKQPQPGPPSERQRQRLEWEKARRGSEGKQPF
jgi:hypothetical protein